MSAELSSLELAIKSVLSTSPWEEDFEVINMPWREEKIGQVHQGSSSQGESDKNVKLVFGIMKNDGNVSPHPPVQRAINLVVGALIKHGHEVGIRCLFINGYYF